MYLVLPAKAANFCLQGGLNWCIFSRQPLSLGWAWGGVHELSPLHHLPPVFEVLVSAMTFAACRKITATSSGADAVACSFGSVIDVTGAG